MSGDKSGQWAGLERESRERAHTAELQAANRRITAYQGKCEALEEQLNTALFIREHKPSDQIISVKPHSHGSEAVACANASDWHVEESVVSSSVNGLNEYDLDIAKSRIDKFFQGVLRLTEIERAGVDINTLILWLGGDLLSGFIHEELAETNALSPTQTILWLVDRLTENIALLRKEGNFKKILIPTSYGNHGRTTKKPRHGTGAANSYEWMMYRILSQTIAGPDIEWQISDGYHNYVQVYDKLFRYHHGDGVKYQGGIGGLTIPVEKALASWNKGQAADIDVFGHYHQFQTNPKWVSNGSLIGYNAYALSIKAAYEPPQQAFFLFDKKRGRTATWPIFVGDE